MDPKAWAGSLVNDFRKRNKGGLWLRLQCAQVADDLDTRIAFPDRINQNNTLFCGYATLAYNVLKSSPQQYVWCAIGLFEDGIGHFGVLGGKKAKLVPSARVRSQPVPQFNGPPIDRMPQADWLMLASMREHFNHVLFDIGEGIPILGLIKKIHGGATGSEVLGALKELGCTDCYDQTNTNTPRDLGFLTAAEGHRAAGRLVFLRIDANLLNKDKYLTSPGVTDYADHWVGLASPVILSPDKKWVSFKVFSWGEIMDVPPGGGGMMHTEDLLKRFYGYAVGKF